MTQKRGPQILKTIESVREWRRAQTGSVGLVPTMGALHEGHLALVRRAVAENDRVAVSIFVNPRQFGDGEDLDRYPRTLEQDLEYLRAASVDAGFIPDVPEIYPSGIVTEINLRELTDRLEGASRPGHFQGVALVVCKLFNIVQPDRAYFGQKDAQQVVVVRKMVDDLNMPVEIVPVETVRDPDGMAVSSRNVFLTGEQRAAARSISAALFSARELFEGGERDAEKLRERVRTMISAEPLLQIDYVSLADRRDLSELSKIDRPAVLSVAVWCGETRLIDNVSFGAP